MAVVWLKIVLGLVMVCLTLLFGLIPIPVLKFLRKRAAKRRREETAAGLDGAGSEARPAGEVEELSAGSRWPGLVLCLLSCFTGGVFLGTCFLHLLPEVNEHVLAMKAAFGWETEYPLGELISCLGFFLIFFVEEIVVTFLQGSHGHSHAPPPLSSDSPLIVHVHEDGEGDGDGVAAGGGGDDGSSSSLPNSPPATEETTETTALKCRDVRLRVNGRSPGGIPFSLSPSSNPDHNISAASKLSARAASPFSEVFTSLEVAEPERCEGPCDGQDEDPPILITSRPHPHSHGVRSVTLVLALSFHSVIEGIAFGIASSEAEATALFLSLIVHKVIVAFSVGLQLARTHAHQLRLVLASIVLLAAMSPVGIAIGILVQTQAESLAKELLLLTFEGAAVGTFLYVTFFEVLIHERDNEHPSLLKLILILIGFGLIGGLRVMEHDHGGGSEHSHSHSGNHSALLPVPH